MMKRLMTMILAVSLMAVLPMTPAVAAEETAVSRAITSAEDNTSFETAQSIPLSTTVRVPMSKAKDYFVFKSTSARGFILNVRRTDDDVYLSVAIYDENKKKLPNLAFKPATLGDSIDVAKPKGKYYVRFEHNKYVNDNPDDYDRYGEYFDFTVMPAKAIDSIKFAAKTAKLGLGVKTQFKYTVKPSTTLSTELKWKSSNTRIATVDSKGNITAKRKGKVTITAYSAANSKKKATIALNVTDNVFSVARPKYKAKKGIYISTKKVYYKGNALYSDIYIYNKTGYKVLELYDIDTFLIDLDNDYSVGQKTGSRWAPKGGIRNNSYKVMTVKFDLTPEKKLNLAGGRYQPQIENYDQYSKAIGSRPELITLNERVASGDAFK